MSSQTLHASVRAGTKGARRTGQRRPAAPSLSLPFDRELVVDLFAGGGGASLGISLAYREPDVAVNHNAIAVGVHSANHPQTEHFTCDVFEVDPLEATRGRPVGVLWASPDCRHHSKAKGGKPRSKKIRGLAWVVVKWAAACMPRLIHLENVEEFADWGPLTADGKPCPARKGLTFRRWVRQLERLGYDVEWRELVAADFGAPTIRKRLYVIARRDGRPIVWPKPTHAKHPTGALKPWRTAAECIDFGLPANSIFGRKKPLAENTCRRVAKGLWRHVLNTAQPFIVPLRGTSAAHTSVHGLGDPLSTVTGGGTHHAVVTPYLTEHANASNQRVFAAGEPLRTQVAQVKGGHFALVSPTLIQTGYGERPGQEPRALDLHKPLGTVVAEGVKHAVVAAHLTHLTHHGDRSGHACDEPMRTVTGANRGEQALVSGALVGVGGRAGQSEPRALDASYHTTTAKADTALVSAFLEQANTGQQGRSLEAPLSTICTSGSHQQLVAAYFVKFYSNGGQWQGCDEPMHTVPTKDRMGLVQVAKVPADVLAPELRERAKQCADFLRSYLPEKFAEPADMVLVGGYVLVDITLRMLAPRELARAQGFPDNYVIERTADGTPVTKTDQVRLIGNSVCPDVAAALIAANAAELIELYEAEVA